MTGWWLSVLQFYDRYDHPGPDHQRLDLPTVTLTPMKNIVVVFSSIIPKIAGKKNMKPPDPCHSMPPSPKSAAHETRLPLF
jgi:hypothetical protein